MTMTKLRRRSVLLLKAPDAKYECAFRAAPPPGSALSFEVHFADVLTFEYLNADKLRDVLLHLADYSVLLVTSPRAGIAIRRVVDALPEAQQKEVAAALQTITVLSVGKATSRELECFGVQCKGDDCGSAEVMIQHIYQDGFLPENVKTKPTVFLCGDKRRDTLPDSFKERQLPFHELTVYQTCAVSDFQLPPACERPDWVVYFSPSGIKATRSVSFPWHEVRKAAIGKTTASALEIVAEETGDSSWNADVVAPKPDAESLARVITESEISNSVR